MPHEVPSPAQKKYLRDRVSEENDPRPPKQPPATGADLCPGHGPGWRQAERPRGAGREVVFRPAPGGRGVSKPLLLLLAYSRAKRSRERSDHMSKAGPQSGPENKTRTQNFAARQLTREWGSEA
ncbi:UNVERIFIED_CONTAM: hypothetical protein K2H54_027650 [Gekko kuhli]